MLAGEGVIAIWNGIAPDARDAFYDWHVNEHMPERVGIPGFRRGRRYIAADATTHPEFFTLYETETPLVITGQDYASRLNDPTPWTRSTTAQFRDTFRSLCRVALSEGPGSGGALLTLRCDLDDPAGMIALLRAAGTAPRVCGVHLCQANLAASAVRTAETRGRADIQAPPAWVAMVEALGTQPLARLLDPAALAAAGVRDAIRGTYTLEFCRGRTAWS